MRILGVDSGGSKTEAVVIDEKGRVLRYFLGRGCNIAVENEENIRKIFSRVFEQVGSVDLAVLGMAGAGRKKHVKKATEILSRIISAKKLIVLSDAEVALIASTHYSPGVLIIAGTGSIAFSLNENRRVHRCGGLGYLLGDEGGGYWIGLRALRLLARILDGREEKSRLAERLMEALGVSDIDELVEKTYSELSVSEIASLAKIVVELSEVDSYARRIVEDACTELARLAKCAADKARLNYPIVYYQGGLFSSKIFRKVFYEKLLEIFKNRVILKKPLFKPVAGSLLIAWRYLGRDLETLLEKLRQYNFLIFE
ncbi:MAG: hypothetical protein DRJ52_07870 [Thermoprotei archaeon]|nr:MAG: hypothetical protein DRJ52_07870 [Thermoprotei archaeon]